jgi:DNA mismatch endonuclease, patch repair protein
MADKISKDQRSYNMSRIRSSNTEIEKTVRKWLFSNGLRYRKNSVHLPGKPDIVIQKYKIVIFVNGCFWHGHIECKISHIPNSSENYWSNKILKTQTRDIENIKKLESLGWKVIIIWECQLKSDSERILKNLLDQIKQNTYSN